MNEVESVALDVSKRPSARRHLLTAVVLAWFGVLILFPLYGIIRETLHHSWAAIRTALSSPASMHAFWMTLILTLGAVVINTVLGTVSALVLSRQRFFGKALLESAIDLPFAISPVVAGFMLILLFGPNGWLGPILERTHIKIVYAFPGMLLATLFVTMPFVIKEILPLLREFSAEQEECAAVLGANRWQTFFRVTLPSIRWGLGYGITLTIARSLGEFGAVLVVSGSIIQKTQTATLLVHDQFADLNYAGAFSAALVLALASFIILNGIQFLHRRKGGG
ncbi:MAG: sulfate ABC transporter permease subunit [Acidobacteriota bacterium]|jgi:sulfate transport system permease protein|nr:sulfate ABC transporter permease subunit [Acidobacteriota bacterium]